MAGETLKLGRPEVAAIIDERHAREADGWRKRRLLAVKLAAKGEYTSGEVAELCGISRSRLFVWLGRVREQGLEGLLQRDKPGPCCDAAPAGTNGPGYNGRAAFLRTQLRGEQAALAQRLAASQFASAEQARRWLKSEHGVDRPCGSVWLWLKKLRGVPRAPRPLSLQEKPRRGRGLQKRPGGKARRP